MTAEERINENKRRVIIETYPEREYVGEYETLAKAAREMFNNPQRVGLLMNILRNNRSRSAFSTKLNRRITIKYKD